MSSSRSHDITVVIPSIPPRQHLLARALASVNAQTYQPVRTITRLDLEREGAPVNRHRALMEVETEWVAFLDDDDEFKPGHLDCLVAAQQHTGADYVFSWYDVVGGTDPLPHFGVPFDHCNPHQTTITTLVRTELAQAAGFMPPFSDHQEPTPAPHEHWRAHPSGLYGGEDWVFTLRCIDLGGYIYHTPYKTWRWHHHGANTSGRPDLWNPVIAQPYPEVLFPV